MAGSATCKQSKTGWDCVVLSVCLSSGGNKERLFIWFVEAYESIETKTASCTFNSQEMPTYRSTVLREDFIFPRCLSVIDYKTTLSSASEAKSTLI